MKRSEMLKLMTDNWLGFYTDMENQDPELYEEVKTHMHSLLCLMEETGMTPPLVKMQNYFGYGWINSWEKE